MRVAVTGGTGFIGARLVEQLVMMGHDVRVLSRSKKNNEINSVDYFQGDITADEYDLIQFVDGVDVLYHCASEIRDEQRMNAVNVLGTKRLIKAAQGRIGKWVQLSSVGAYGKQRSGHVNETTPEDPVGVYEVTKTQSDHIVSKVAESKGMEYVIIRPSIVFGEDMTNRSLYQMVEMIRRRLFFYIGKPGVLMNYIHVKDVVRALLLCGLHTDARNNTYILSDNIELEEMVMAISQGLGIHSPSIRLPEWFVRLVVKILHLVPGFPLSESRIDALTGRATYDSLKIMNELNYNHSVTLVDAFREFAITTTNKK